METNHLTSNVSPTLSPKSGTDKLVPVLPDPLPACLLALEDDIPLRVAYNAHAHTSHVPDERARQEREGYSALIFADFAALQEFAPEALPLLIEEFTRYRQGMKRHKLAQLGARAACVSWMITGRSNFNVGRAEKANRTERNRAEELSEFRERALSDMRKKLRPDLQPIRSGDADAVERLEADLKSAKEAHEMMKAANVIIRNTFKAKMPLVEQVPALVALGFTEAAAKEALTPDVMGGYGFASYALSNSSANIRRMEDRLNALRTAKATPTSTTEGPAATIEDDPPANRVRLIFPSKPAPGVIGDLKRCGFRWAPSVPAWQAFRNPVSLRAARRFAGLPEAG